MATLSEQDRADIWRLYMQFSSNIREEIGLTKDELRASVNATDDWIEANKSSFNNALPSKARGALSAKQKARLFMEVAKRKFNMEA